MISGLQFSLADKIALFGCVGVIVFLYLQVSSSQYIATSIEVSVGEELTHKLDIQRDQVLKIDGEKGSSVLEIKSNRVRFISSTCSTQFCVRNGWQEHAGDFVACLPNEISVYLPGDNKRYDAINF